jgi:hypothetical protein
VSVENELDALFGTSPEQFAARRKELAAAAKERGDSEQAKVISAARRPTTAAWVVNRLALTDATARPRLAELHAALHAAHAAMDGPRIRELSKEQRALIQELTRAGFVSAGLSNPTSALREEVTATLQAAVADPDVAARLGRLTKSETWSGFGDFGVSSAVVARHRSGTGPVAKKVRPAPVARNSDPEQAVIAQALRDRDAAETALRQARAALGEALTEVDTHQEEVAAARRHRDAVQAVLVTAEADLKAAETDLGETQLAADEAQHRVQSAEARLRQADAQVPRHMGR